MKGEILCLILLSSCTTGRVNKKNPLRDNAWIDSSNSDSVAVRPNFLNRYEVLKFYENKHRIIQNKELSCFQDARSFNYLEIPEYQVEVLRPLVAKKAISKDYINLHAIEESAHEGQSFEVRHDKIKVNKKICFKKIDSDSKTSQIISEIYE